MLGNLSPPVRVVLVIALFFFSALPAQEKLLPVFRFDRLTTSNGLPSNEIRSNVVTDRQGFIWIGTVNGLARYDGNSCKVYRNVKEDPHSISSNGIMYLFLDSRGLLWIGTGETGFSLYDAPNDRFVNFPRHGFDKILQGLKPVFFIYEDQAGDIWLTSHENKVVRADMSGSVNETLVDSVLAHVNFEQFQLEGSRDFVFVGRWDQQSLLFGTARGFFTRSHATRQLSRLSLPTASGVNLDTVRTMAFCWESPDRLWIATRSNGLYLFDRSRSSLTQFHKRSAGGKGPWDDLIVDALMDSSGRLWITTTTTLDLFDPSSGVYKEYLTSPIDPPKHPYAISVDRMKRLWIATMDDGLYFLTPQSMRFSRYGLRGEGGKPRAMESIDDAGDGTCWIATEGKVVRVRMTDLKVLQTVDLFRGEKPTYWRAGVMDSYRDAKGTLWYGTWGLGLYKFVPGTGRVTNFRFSQIADVINKNDVCFSITGGTGDSLWIGAYRDGLLQFDTHTNKFSRRPTVGSTTPVNVYQVMKAADGRIWISDEQQGVIVLDPATNIVEHFMHDPDRPTSLSYDRGRHSYQDARGNIWVGTKDLDLWNPETRSFVHFPNGHFGNTSFVMPMGTDPQGRLWVYYYPGVVGVLDRATGNFSNFGQADGLCANAYEMSRLKNGMILLVGWGGMNIISPDSVTAAQLPPPLVLSRFVINDSLNMSAHSLNGSGMNLRYDQSTLEAEFAAIDPGTAHLIDYFYRLEGLEDAWVHPGDRRFVRYPGLIPGDYVFKVKAVNKFGRWSEQEIALALSIAPPWWSTWWFRLMAAGALLGLLGFIYKREVTRLSKEKLVQQEFSCQIESQEAERKRLAAELHDGLGQDLLVVNNELQQFLQEGIGSKGDLRQAAALVQESIQSVREISSNLHPHHLDRLGFCAAVEAMTENISRSTGLTIQRSCDDIDRLVPKETEIHMYRIIQEALSNVVRHASAKNVDVHVKKISKSIEITVTDDGKGFDVNDALERPPSRPSDEGLHGFGLSSMTERVRIIGGTMSIKSTPGSGTTLHVSLPYS